MSTSIDRTRFYENKFKDYSDYSDVCQNAILTTDGNDLHDEFKHLLKDGITKLLEKLERNRKHWDYSDDLSVYTGLSGIAYMYYQYGKYFNEPAYIAKALELIRVCICKSKSKRQITFLTGTAGPLALAAIIYHHYGTREESQEMISKLKSLSVNVTEGGSDLPDELLYGRIGYLSSLLLVNANISPPPIEDELIAQVASCILHSGNVYSKSKHCGTPLMYSWHGKEYVGGAHGLAGILYILLQARKYLTQQQLDNNIKPALIYIQKLKFSSGNFPSSIGSSSDRLVHWCHGAPGMTMLFSLAYKVFKEDQFLETALQCGEVVWRRGLLRKGYGICHGVSGNAYTFLNLFQETKDPKHLYRACKFAEWCIDHGTHEERTPDRPFSLFEGLAGVIYFLCDLYKPNSAKFPAYTL